MAMTKTAVQTSQRKRRSRARLQNDLQFDLMAFPAVILLLVFCYLPMVGVVIAFQDYKLNLGIFGSPFVGFENFEFFFTSSDAWRVTRNTLLLNAVFISLGIVFSVAFSLFLYEIKQRFLVKIYQTSIILPNFISWVVAGYMCYILLNPSLGFMNQFLKIFGVDQIDWYSNPKYWPVILTIASLWKSVGMNSVIYYAALMGIDSEYYEAADLDGATRLQKAIYISIPCIIPTIIVLFILSLGGIFRSDFGLFYQLTRDIGKLYSTTDVIDTYIFRALRTVGDIGMSSAVGLFQSIVGFVTIIVANAIVRKINRDSAIF